MEKRYANERDFSRALCTYLREAGAFVQRIESGLTGRGIPDIYCIINDKAYWIETKRVGHSLKDFEKIPWRPGQQAWLHGVTKMRQNAFTLSCFNKEMLLIKHDNIYTDNIVPVGEDCTVKFSTFPELITFLKK